MRSIAIYCSSSVLSLLRKRGASLRLGVLIPSLFLSSRPPRSSPSLSILFLFLSAPPETVTQNRLRSIFSYLPSTRPLATLHLLRRQQSIRLLSIHMTAFDSKLLDEGKKRLPGLCFMSSLLSAISSTALFANLAGIDCWGHRGVSLPRLREKGDRY